MISLDRKQNISANTQYAICPESNSVTASPALISPIDLIGSQSSPNTRCNKNRKIGKIECLKYIAQSLQHTITFLSVSCVASFVLGFSAAGGAFLSICLLSMVAYMLIGYREFVEAEACNKDANTVKLYLLDKCVEFHTQVNPRLSFNEYRSLRQLAPLACAASGIKNEFDANSLYYSILDTFAQSLKDTESLCSFGSKQQIIRPPMDKLIEHLRDPSSLVPIGIPISSKDHGMWLCIEKEIGGGRINGYRITLFNTGEGLQKHAQWISDRHKKYQTFLSYHVGDELIEDRTAFEDFIGFLISSMSVETSLFYEQFEEKLEKSFGAHKLPSSSLEVDYERHQGNGSCNVQRLMAFLRYLVMKQLREIGGYSPIRQIAAYKYLKAKLLISLSVPRMNALEDTYEEAARDKLRKQELEVELYEFASNEEFYMAIVNAMPRQGSIESGVEMTQEGRYYHLRQLILSLSLVDPSTRNSALDAIKGLPGGFVVSEAIERRVRRQQAEYAVIENKRLNVQVCRKI